MTTTPTLTIEPTPWAAYQFTVFEYRDRKKAAIGGAHIRSAAVTIRNARQGEINAKRTAP